VQLLSTGVTVGSDTEISHANKLDALSAGFGIHAVNGRSSSVVCGFSLFGKTTTMHCNLKSQQKAPVVRLRIL